MTRTLIDTGALIAYLDASDRFHAWTVAQWRALPPPLITCEPVLTEAAYLVQRGAANLDSLWELLRRDVIQIQFELETEMEAVAALMKRYADLPMDLADACLVRMSELRGDTRVFTLDSDFKIFRRHARQTIPLIFPE